MSEKIKRMELPKYKKEKKRMELPKYKKEKKRSRMAELLIRRAKGIDREASGRKKKVKK